MVTQYHPEFLQGAADAAGGTFIAASATDKASRVKSALATLAHADAREPGRRDEDAALSVVPVSGLRSSALDTAADRATRAASQSGQRRRKQRPRPAVLFAALRSTDAPRSTESQQAVDAYKHEPVRVNPRRCSETRSRRATSRRRRSTTSARRSSPADSDQERRRGARPRRRRARTTSSASAALFNLGLAHLKPGSCRADRDRTDGELDSTLAVYKKALLMRPGDLDAKWNYELALRKKQTGRRRRRWRRRWRQRTSRRRDRRRSRRVDSASSRPNSCSAARRAKSATCSRRSRSRTASSRRREERTGDRRARCSSRNSRSSRTRRTRRRPATPIEVSVAVSAPGNVAPRDRRAVAGPVRRSALVRRAARDVRSAGTGR